MIPGQEKFFKTAAGRQQPASAQLSEAHQNDQLRSKQMQQNANFNKGYATVQVANTQDNKQHGVNGVKNPPKVPPLAFESTFNLADAPLRRLHDAQSYISGGQTQENGAGDQNQYMSTNQQVMTTDIDALRRPPVTVKQTDIIFIPDKGLQDSYVSFDVSRKQANLPALAAEQLTGGAKSGVASARGGGSASERGSALAGGSARAQSSSRENTNTYRGTSVAQPVSHHYQDLGDLMILSRQEASVTHRVHIRDNLRARAPLGCSRFQYEMTCGVLAIAQSPDGHCVAVLCSNFFVLVHDKVKQKTFQLDQLDMWPVDTQLQLEHLLEQRKSFGGTQTTETFKIYVSNGITSIYVVAGSERLIASWTNSFMNKPQLKKAGQPGKRPEQQLPRKPEDERKPNHLIGKMFRSNSASRMDEKKREQPARSNSRIKDFFMRTHKRARQPSEAELDQKESTNLFGGNRVATQEQIRSKSSSRLVEGQGCQRQERVDEVEILVGCWTNVTLRSNNKQDLTIQALASTNTIQYSEDSTQEKAFSMGMPQRFGSGHRVDTLGEFHEQGSLITVRMYNHASYVDMFNQKLYNDLTCRISPRTQKKDLRDIWKGVTNLADLDNDTRKVLVFSQQSVEQDKIHKGGVWYQNPFYLVDKAMFATEIDFMGILPEQRGDIPIKRTLICSCDHQGNLMAVAVNSMHKIYCQILFVSLKNQFVSVMKLFEFVSADDNPPFDAKGKTNLQVDDLAWTRNDAFVILMFNTGALAVLPRLGSQLLKIYNPTIINVHYKDAANFTQYKVPRGFNELIPKNDIVAKVKKWKKPTEAGTLTQHNGSSGYRLKMHPSEDAFIIYSGSVAYIMQLELEPELEELFDKENKNYYFMRFCFSMKSLSRDQETLQKIPQLLTSKLPICEFEKNQEKLENQDTVDVAQRIQTASQINPWQMEERRMDTIQSFDADFTEEADKVLLNFKHLLFAYRWNASTTLNYLEWLITITNDIFYYYLKQSEPMYAYHALKIAEFYMTRVLEKSDNVNQYKVMDPKQQRIVVNMSRQANNSETRKRPDDAKIESCNVVGRMFKGMLRRMMDPVYEIYSHGLASQTLMKEVAGENQTLEMVKQSLEKIMPDKKTLAEKIAVRTQYVDKLPLLVAKGDGNVAFSFQKNYMLLSYYCLIQFRNYQANNFNILFLIIASYIFKQHVNASFIEGLWRVSQVLFENYLELEKTNELDLFFGKCGLNMISEAPQKLEFVQKWIELVAPHQSCYLIKLLNQKTLRQIQDANYLSLTSDRPFPTDAASDDQMRKKLAEIRPEVKQLTSFISALERLDYLAAMTILLESSLHFKISYEIPFKISATQRYGICLTLLANAVFHMASRDERAVRSVSMPAAMECIVRMSIKLDKKSPINTVSQHSKIFDAAFVNNKTPKQINAAKKALKNELGLASHADLCKFGAMLLAYVGDFQRAALLLKPTLTQPASMELLIFNVLIQSLALKNHSNNFLILIDQLQDYSMKNIKDFKQLHQTTERLNAIQVVKYTMAEVSCTMQRIMSASQNSLFYREYLWACFCMLPHGVSILFKEQVLRDSITNIKSIFSFYIRNVERGGSSNRDSFPLKLVVHEFPLAKSFFEKTLEGNMEHLEFILPSQTLLRRRFFQQVELILICLYDQHDSQLLFETIEQLNQKFKSRAEATAGHSNLVTHPKLVQTAQLSNLGNGQSTQPVQPPTEGQVQQPFDLSATNIVTQRVLQLIEKNFAKFGKIFSYLKIRTDMRAMDSQVQFHKETNRTKAIEGYIMVCCKSLQHMIHFPKYTAVQGHIRRALGILAQLLFHTKEIVNAEVRKKVVLPVISLINYGKFDRKNKQLLSSILEMCKQRPDQEEFQDIVVALEACIFDRGVAASSQTASARKSHQLSRAQQSSKMANSADGSDDKLELKKMVEQVTEWMTFQVLPTLDFKKLNHKGHRRCIEAKKDMFRHANTMHTKLQMRMTQCSLFFRGVNFEIKRVNVFGLKDEDLKNYAELVAEDFKEAETTKLAAKKATNGAALAPEDGIDEAQEEEGADGAGDAMNKTRVEKMADDSVFLDMKQKGLLPELDFKSLIMTKHQIYNHPDLPKNCDLGDVPSMIGIDCLQQEIHCMDYQRRVKREKKEYTAVQATQKAKMNEKGQDETQGADDSLQNKKSSQPQAFFNEFSLPELNLEQAKTATGKEAQTDQQAQSPKASARDAMAYAGLSKPSFKMGRIFFKKKANADGRDGEQSGIKKFTLRKNSARRIMATEKILSKTVTSSQLARADTTDLPPKHRMPPRSKKVKRMDSPSKDELALKEMKAKKKKLQPFSLVFLKKKNKQTTETTENKTGEDHEKEAPKKQFKVRMPLKMIAKGVSSVAQGKQSTFAPSASQSKAAARGTEATNQEDSVAEEVEQKLKSTKKNFKPFQVQLIRVNKKAAAEKANADAESSKQASTDEQKKQESSVEVLQDIQKVMTDMSTIDKRQMMITLMNQLDHIQDRADHLKKNINKTKQRATEK